MEPVKGTQRYYVPTDRKDRRKRYERMRGWDRVVPLVAPDGTVLAYGSTSKTGGVFSVRRTDSEAARDVGKMRRGEATTNDETQQGRSGPGRKASDAS